MPRMLGVGADSGDADAFDPDWAPFDPASGPADPFYGQGSDDSFSDDPSNYFDTDASADSVYQGEIDVMRRQLEAEQQQIADLQSQLMAPDAPSFDPTQQQYGGDGSYGGDPSGGYGYGGDGSDGGGYGPPIGGPVDPSGGAPLPPIGGPVDPSGGIGSPLPVPSPIPSSQLAQIAANLGLPAPANPPGSSPMPIAHVIAPPTFHVAPSPSTLQSIASNLSSLMGPQGLAPILAAHPSAPPIAPPPAPPKPVATGPHIMVAPAPSARASLLSNLGLTAPAPTIHVHASGAAAMCNHDPLAAAQLVVAGARNGNPNAKNYVFRTAQLASRGSRDHVGAFMYLTRAAQLADRDAWVKHYTHGSPDPLYGRPRVMFRPTAMAAGAGIFDIPQLLRPHYAAISAPRAAPPPHYAARLPSFYRRNVASYMAGIQPIADFDGPGIEGMYEDTPNALGGTIPGVPGFGTFYGQSFLYGMGELS